MSDIEQALIAELRTTVAELEYENNAMARQIQELRGAVAALMEPGTPRVLLGRTGIIIMDEEWVKPK